MLDLVYTSGNNSILTALALSEQWLIGMRSDKSPACAAIQFLDIDYQAPNFARHLELARIYRPKYAVVPDLSDVQDERADVLRALRQSEQLARYCEVVLIVPKRSKQLEWIPKDAAIGYSVPTSNGGAKYGVWKLAGRRVHLLGGSPHMQMRLYRHMKNYCSVLSADGNMAQKIAFRASKYWQDGKWMMHPDKHRGIEDLAYICIQRSLRCIRESWQRLQDRMDTVQRDLWEVPA